MIEIYAEYLHLKSNKVYSLNKQYPEGSPEFNEFQKSDNPKELGFTYERDFIEAETEKPETV
jgi:hypothetical protein